MGPFVLLSWTLVAIVHGVTLYNHFCISIAESTFNVWNADSLRVFLVLFLPGSYSYELLSSCCRSCCLFHDSLFQPGNHIASFLLGTLSTRCCSWQCTNVCIDTIFKKSHFFSYLYLLALKKCITLVTSVEALLASDPEHGQSLYSTGSFWGISLAFLAQFLGRELLYGLSSKKVIKEFVWLCHSAEAHRLEPGRNRWAESSWKLVLSATFPSSKCPWNDCYIRHFTYNIRFVCKL